MITPLNLYATRVFSEHPTSMWALDEPIGYLSLLSSGDQDLSSWNIVGATSVNGKNSEEFLEVPPTSPFAEEYVSGLVESIGNGGLVSMTTVEPVLDVKINKTLGSTSLGFYVFTYDRVVQARLGFSYTDSVTLQDHETLRLTNIPANRSWAFVAETFSLPENVSNIRPIIEFSYLATELVYQIAVNGISFGQWSEEFQTSSLGVIATDLPESLPIDGKGVEAFSYGLQGSSGYYLASENNLYAKNSGVPLVFGSSSSTVISPNQNGLPSLIVPGEGFLNKSGQYKPLTAEFWINVQNNSLFAKKYLGHCFLRTGCM